VKKITIELKKRRCSYCGIVTDTEMREFDDCGSPVSSPVCYPCQCSIGIAVSPICAECKRELVFVKKERFWGCPEHGKQEVKEFPDGRTFKYKRCSNVR